jgi:hypothetical protein
MQTASTTLLNAMAQMISYSKAFDLGGRFAITTSIGHNSIHRTAESFDHLLLAFRYELLVDASLTNLVWRALIRCKTFYDALDLKTGSCSSEIRGNTKVLKLAGHSSNFRKQECKPQNWIKLSASKIPF